MKRRFDLIGARFGRLFVHNAAPDLVTPRRTRAQWLCWCDCGREVTVRSDHLASGAVQSCGCFGAERRRAASSIANFKHGMVGTQTYRSWSGMVQRCTNPKNPKFDAYGGRGISVCPRWFEFSNFLADMGPSPEGHSIDRIDVNGNYEPGNCRWADAVTQRANRRDSLLGS